MRQSRTLSLLSQIREQDALDGVATFLTTLLQNPECFSHSISAVDTELEISWAERPTPRNVTELSLHAIAFGILWQQERKPGRPNVRDPFEYRTPAEVQEDCPDDGVAALFGSLVRRPNGPAARLEADYVAREFDLAEPLAHHVLTMIIFGTFIEREGLEEVALS